MNFFLVLKIAEQEQDHKKKLSFAFVVPFSIKISFYEVRVIYHLSPSFPLFRYLDVKGSDHTSSGTSFPVLS